MNDYWAIKTDGISYLEKLIR